MVEHSKKRVRSGEKDAIKEWTILGSEKHLFPTSLSHCFSPPPNPSSICARFPPAPTFPSKPLFTLLSAPPFPSILPFFHPSPIPLLLTPSRVCLLMRVGGTIVQLLNTYGNRDWNNCCLFKQCTLSSLLQLGQIWLSPFCECRNKLLSLSQKLIHFLLSSDNTALIASHR